MDSEGHHLEVRSAGQKAVAYDAEARIEGNGLYGTMIVRDGAGVGSRAQLRSCVNFIRGIYSKGYLGFVEGVCVGEEVRSVQNSIEICTEYLHMCEMYVQNSKGADRRSSVYVPTFI